jgi:hypothetical protein
MIFFTGLALWEGNANENAVNSFSGKWRFHSIAQINALDASRAIGDCATHSIAIG